MTPCPVCNSINLKVYFSGSDRLFRTTTREFTLLQCQNCNIVFLSPSPTKQDLASYYPAGYWWQTSSPSQLDTWWHKVLELYRRRMLGEHIRRIMKHVPADSDRTRGRILDLGCGDGLFLNSCGRLPFQRFGLDQSMDALSAAHLRRGLRVIQGNLESLPFSDRSMRVITMFHVLEHLSAPHQLLQEIHRVLEPGGWLILQVPNAGSLQQKLLGSSWAGFDVPRHLVNYSAQNLQALLESKHFRVAHIGHLSARDNPATIAMSLFPRLYPPARRLVRQRPSAGRTLANIIPDLTFLFVALVAAPFAFCESLIRRGGTILVEAQKA